MANNVTALADNKLQGKKMTGHKITWNTLVKQKQLIFMSVPMLIYILIFSYVPIWGWLMAFQNYKPAKGFFEQKWVGLQNFKYLFKDDNFIRDFRNTISMSFINLILSYVTAIVLALLLNEIKNVFFKRTVQTISYLPHFLSWVIVTGIVATCLSTEGGIVNIVLVKLGIINSPINWLSEGKYFWGIVGATNVWKELGWNTIIYLGAITAIDPALYEAAGLDGAGRFRKMWHVTLPGIKATFVVLLIMSIGHVMEAGFEIQYLLGKGPVLDWSETIDIYVIKYGINQFNYSLATAAGIFKSVIAIIMLFLANNVAKRLGEERLI
ncbi:ABC transporter permease subunit [Clostridium sp. BNL1100]|uniref:ABC transporter permease n=1 Tax=Clostridium sp. BNL1100 TaxID=755731 RepID=UPI00024A7B27|nr:ABC transporter permease subunit [Clostridium sp. BNL1100]AEY64447.1 ABC-type polysaccharide transport system, permease component [Clostridium sp. BNL1100]